MHGGSVGQPDVLSGVVKQELLSVTSPGTEMSGREFPEFTSRNRPAGKVIVAQGAGDPDVDRKGAGLIAAEEQDAIGDLGSDAGQFEELGAGLLEGEGAQGQEIEVATNDAPGRFVEVPGAETHAALAQVGFGGAGDGLGWWEGEGWWVTWRHGDG
jgi:hypothetical protein